MSLAAVAPRREPRSAPIEGEHTLSHSTLYLSLSLSLLCQATFDSSSTSYRCLQLGVRLINEGCRFISKLSELRTTRAVLPRCVPKIQLTFCAVMTHNLARTPEIKKNSSCSTHFLARGAQVSGLQLRVPLLLSLLLHLPISRTDR